jgi:hypothetical protein
VGHFSDKSPGHLFRVIRCSTPRSQAALLCLPMSEEISSPSTDVPAAAEKPAKLVKKNVRRVSSKPSVQASEAPSEPMPVTDSAVASAAEASIPRDWPEPEAPEETRQQDNNKRNKRRRRKGKGGGQAPVDAQSSGGEGDNDDPAGDSVPAAPAPPRQSQPHSHRPKSDPELLAKFAWKIYLAEISEEGVALVGDNDARDLARRCFRLAEIFLDEQSRKR